MATNSVRPLSAVVGDNADSWQEQQRFYNFLCHYDLQQYHEKFLRVGVNKMAHLKDVDDQSLEELGFTRPERVRLRKKVDKYFGFTAKFVQKVITSKKKKFDAPAPEMAHPPKRSDAPRTPALITKDQLKFGKLIGEGSHGSVHDGAWHDAHGAVAVAIKTLHGKKEMQEMFIKEASSMTALNHPHIIRLYGIVLSEPLMLVEELAPLGCLSNYLQKHGRLLTLPLFHSYACQVADAMRYLEQQRIVHRDLAARNVLLATEDCVKLSDFGMARVLDDHSDVYNLSNLQTKIPIAWTAVEALLRAKFSSASDVWSYGVLLWEVYSLAANPWEGLSPTEIRDALVNGERLARPERCPVDVFQLMLSCWDKNPQDRPTFPQLHTRMLQLRPQCVRAVEHHDVADDNSLSFRTGDIIYVIDKPKFEWMFGMNKEGKIGQFLADHVTTELNALGDLKEKVLVGKAKPENMAISSVTNVEHVMHWDSLGNKWVNGGNQGNGSIDVLDHIHQQSSSPASVRSSQAASSAASGPSAPPRDTAVSPPPRSTSPAVCKPKPHPSASPLLQVSFRSHPFPTSSSKDVHSPQPYVQPVISKGDASFFGTIRYATQAEIIGRSNEPSLAGIEDESQRVDLNSPSQPFPLRVDSISEDNKYVSITRALDPQITQDLADKLEEADAELVDDDTSEYTKMQSHSVERQPPFHSYVNLKIGDAVARSNTMAVGCLRETVSPYGVPQRRERVLSSGDSSGMSSPDQDFLTGDFPQVALPMPLMPAPATTAANTSASQSISQANRGSNSPEDAITPSHVRYISKNTRYNAVPNNRPLFSSDEPAINGQRRPIPTPRQSKSVSDDTRKPPTLAQVNRTQSLSKEPVHPAPLVPTHRRVSEGVVSTPPALPPPRVSTPPGASRTTSLKRESSSENGSALSHLESVLLAEFPGTTPEMCKQALEMHKYNKTHAREEIQVQILLGMNLPYIDAHDCRRALSHCQHSTDRAATWLLESNEDTARKIS